MSQKENRKFQIKGRVIFFATNNINKFNEARKVLVKHNIAVGMLRIKSLETQDDNLEAVAKASVVDAFRKCRLPMIVEDAGLFINALKGFPGPYSAYSYKTIGNQGILKLMQGIANREAYFESAVAYLSPETRAPICFNGRIDGQIAIEERKGNGKSGFGFDPIFQPCYGDETFAEMSMSEKNNYSHRAKAFRKFAEWYVH